LIHPFVQVHSVFIIPPCLSLSFSHSKRQNQKYLIFLLTSDREKLFSIITQSFIKKISGQKSQISPNVKHPRIQFFCFLSFSSFPRQTYVSIQSERLLQNIVQQLLRKKRKEKKKGINFFWQMRSMTWFGEILFID
jgi:hypothetical protein